MSHVTLLMHELLFDLPAGALLSASSGLTPWRVLLVPIAGGVLLAIVMSASGRFRSRQVINGTDLAKLALDSIELAANVDPALGNLRFAATNAAPYPALLGRKAKSLDASCDLFHVIPRTPFRGRYPKPAAV